MQIAQNLEMAGPVIGIDFDHTLIDYSALLRDIVETRGLLAEIPQNKKNIRDALWLLPEGDLKWREIQEEMYGQRIAEAKPAAGVLDFLQACKKKRIEVYVVSHKTEYSSLRPGINFRLVAQNWMKNNAFFSNEIGLNENKVFFEPTRREKIQRIKQIGCTHFIDDLEEVFSDLSFPPKVVKILYASPPSQSSGVILKKNWGEIHDYFFGWP